jgi:predicted nucleic acid-binding protein
MVAARAGIFVDSGAWIALFRERDDHHREADDLFRRAIGDRVPLLTTNLVLAEVHRFVLHRAGIRPAALAVERIATSRHVRIVFADAEHDRGARQWLARFSDQRITYTDAVSFVVMKAAGLRAAMTFDRDFTVAGFSLWRG